MTLSILLTRIFRNIYTSTFSVGQLKWIPISIQQQIYNRQIQNHSSDYVHSSNLIHFNSWNLPEYDDGGLSSSGRRCVAGISDKASTEPLNKELNDSVDSLEEKNPDIIPQNNAEDEYQDEERAFERLNNATLRVYSRMQSPSSQLKNNGSYDGYTKTVSKV